MSVMLTADWFPAGKSAYFRKFEIYSMEWSKDFNMENVTISASSYGGPFAVRRDRKKLVKVQGSGKPVISIYSACGMQISSIVGSKPIIHAGWSSSEELLCIEDDGSVLIYDMFGFHQHTFSMCDEVRVTKVIEAKVFNTPSGTGVAVLTSAYRFFLVNSVKEPKVRQFPEVPGLNAPPSSWAILCEDRQTRVLMARERELYLLSHNQATAVPIMLDFQDRLCSVVEMAVSLNSKHIALFTDKGRLWMGSADLRTKYCEAETRCPSRPLQLVWCGSDAVVVHWEGVLLLVTRHGDTLTYSSDSAIHLIPEIDCVRMVSSSNHELVQSVPLVLQKILRINSTDPGFFLLQASKQFQRRSHRADEYIRLVKDKLPVAVDQCIDAAGCEFETDNQKMLIRAAQFGKGFVPNLDPDKYVRMCRILRVLNAVRDHKVSLPLTYLQLQELTITGLLERLVRRRHYYMAIQICKHLKLAPAEGSSRILAEWAFYKVAQAKQDREQVAREIASKLGKAPGISYKEIALKANNCGHTQLAIKLMDYEPRAREQVPLLLDLGQEVPALVKAIESGDTDLIHTVLLCMHGKMTLADFYLKIRNYPLAQALYIKYCRQNNWEALHDIYKQDDDHNSLAACHIRDAYLPENSSSREASLAAAQECYKQARNDFLATACEEQLKLLKQQRSLEDKFKREFVGISLHDTLQQLLSLSEVKLADGLRTEYKVPDRRYWWLRILALAERGEWEQMEKFSKEKKSPIGYEPFVEVCLEHNKRAEARKYMSRVTDDLKVKYFTKLGLLDEAAQTAFDQKDIQSLLVVQTMCGAEDRTTAERINVFLAQLSNKK